MNNAAVDSNIEPDCHQLNVAKQMQLCKDQLRNKHVPFHKKESLLWKQYCLHKIRKLLKKGHYSKPASFHFFMKELHFSKDYVAY